MLRKSAFWSVAIVAVAFTSLDFAAIAQEDAPTEADTTLTTAAPATPAAQPNAFVIVCDSKPSQIIVLDAQGKWMPTVRSATVSVEIGKTPTITCVMWSGQFKPTNPDTKVWTLAQMKSVTAQQFQQYIDQLQSDPGAIARSLSGGTTGNGNSGTGNEE